MTKEINEGCEKMSKTIKCKELALVALATLVILSMTVIMNSTVADAKNVGVCVIGVPSPCNGDGSGGKGDNNIGNKIFVSGIFIRNYDIATKMLKSRENSIEKLSGIAGYGITNTDVWSVAGKGYFLEVDLYHYDPVLITKIKKIVYPYAVGIEVTGQIVASEAGTSTSGI